MRTDSGVLNPRNRREGRGARPDARYRLARARLTAAPEHPGPDAFLWLTMADLLVEDPMDPAGARPHSTEGESHAHRP